MKKPSRTARPTVDTDHLLRLHREAIIQLNLLTSVLTASIECDGEIRDLFDRIATAHTDTYLALIHTIGLHDTALGTHFASPPPNTTYLALSSSQRLRLIDTLIRYHRTQISRLRMRDITQIYSSEAILHDKTELAELIGLFAI